MAIADFLGIPYLLNGRDRHGTDCLGLVILYRQSLGLNAPDGDGRPIGPDWRGNSEARARDWLAHNAVQTDSPAPGDVVLFRLPRVGIHLGVMADAENILHIFENSTSTLTPLHQVRRHVIGIYRLI